MLWEDSDVFVEVEDCGRPLGLRNCALTLPDLELEPPPSIRGGSQWLILTSVRAAIGVPGFHTKQLHGIWHGVAVSYIIWGFEERRRLPKLLVRRSG